MAVISEVFEGLKKRANQLFAEVGRDARKLAPGTLYYTLCAAALLPVAEAAAKGEARPEVLIPLAMSIAGDVGKNLLANVMEKSAAESSRDEIVEFVKEEIAKGGATAINECDALLTRLDAIIQTQKSVSEENRAWFAAEIKEQLKQVKSHIQIEVSERGVIVMGANSGMINTGTIINNYYAGGGTGSKQDLGVAIQKYLQWVVDQNAKITLRGIDRKNDPPAEKLSIDLVYVPLEAQVAYLHRDEKLSERVRGLSHRVKAKDAQDPEGEISLSDALKLGERLIVIGGPGSGKSTLLMYMAWAVGSSLLDKTDRVAYEKLGLKDPLPLPIIFPVAKYSERRKKDGAAIQDFISDWLRHKDAGANLPPDFFSCLLASDQHILALFDGLDEIPDENDRAKVRAQIESFLSGKPNVRAVITCRTVAYKGNATFANDFCRADVKPLDFERHITPMVARVYAHIFGKDKTSADFYTDRLLKGIQQLEADRRKRLGERADRLVDSPLMTRLLIIVNYSEREMPRQRAELFEKAVATLLKVDYGPDEDENQRLAGDWETRRELAQYIAFEMHKQGEKQGREIDHKQLEEILRKRVDIEQGEKKDFLAHIRGRGGLIEERDENYRFLHLALQEFLTARYLFEVMSANEGRSALIQFLQDKLNDSWWRECILLLAGYKNSYNFIKELSQTGNTPADQLAALELAAVSSLEAKSVTESLRAELANSIVKLFDDAQAVSQASAILRAAAGRALTRLGDPREEVMKVEAMKFCFVPAGPFDMGSDGTDELAFDDEKPLRENVEVPAFWISQHPINNAQFAQFVKAGGYNKPEYWVEAKAVGYWRWQDGKGEMAHGTYRLTQDNKDIERARSDWSDKPHDYGEPYSLPNHPVVGITWFEALAFTRWLNETQNLRGRGLMAALPSETEWEKAARGGHARIRQPKVENISVICSGMPQGVEMLEEPAPNRRNYPWGNDKPDDARANFDGAGINSTSALGCFPLGASPYGCQDMSGNVWEWCFTKWQDNYEHYREDEAFNKEVSKDDRRVVRGGSCFSDLRYVRCAYRGRNGYDSFDNGLGFRIVLRSHLSLGSVTLNSEPLNT